MMTKGKGLGKYQVLKLAKDKYGRDYRQINESIQQYEQNDADTEASWVVRIMEVEHKSGVYFVELMYSRRDKCFHSIRYAGKSCSILHIRPINSDDLLKAGYVYKLDALTEEEREEWLHGSKWNDPKTGQEVNIPSRDFDYFYKEFPGGAQVQIFHVIQEFYYNGIRLSEVSQLAAIERSAQENKQWDDLLKTIPDSTPVVDYELPDTLTEAQQIITLVGGPLNGKTRAYIKIAKFFVEIIGRKVISGKVISQMARYQQDEENESIYHFKQII